MDLKNTILDSRGSTCFGQNPQPPTFSKKTLGNYQYKKLNYGKKPKNTKYKNIVKKPKQSLYVERFHYNIT